ncbi:MAG: gliding motility-associated C-terminal domain-containing protein [Bacteroidetes bacterium]|nr:gliding motility-associated C-terminal domain-containing protein [Bacteroidota bacterium]
MVKYLRFVIILFFNFSCLQAQIDTSFWFVAPSISATMGNNPIGFNIQTYNLPSTVLIRQPANIAGVNLTITIPANTNTLVDVSAFLSSIQSSPTNSVSNKGIYISSSTKISVEYAISATNNKEMMSLKGSNAIGSDFFLPFPNNLTSVTTPTDANVGFDIVAVKSGTTTVVITPKAACIGRTKNVPFVISLTQGQTFSLSDSKVVNPSQLAGSIISSDSSIAVSISGAINSSSLCQSYFADQLTNSSAIGSYYVLNSGNSLNEFIYLLAPQNASSFTLTSLTSTVSSLINSTETFSTNSTLNGISYITSDKPIYALHVTGFGCKYSGAQVAPAYCAGTYTNAFTRVSSDSLFILLTIRNGFQSSFTLTANGSPVPVSSAAFTTVPGSSNNLVTAKLYFSTSTIPLGAYILVGNTMDVFNVGVLNGGTTGGSNYAFVSPFTTKSFVKANSVPSATICANAQFTLNGTIGGGPILGYWSTNGYGAFSLPSNSITGNVYTPALVDTIIKPVPQTTPATTGGVIKFILTSTGICPNVSDTFKLNIKQPPLVTAGLSQFVCSNNPTVQLNGNVISTSSLGVWSAISPASGSFSPSSSIFNPIYYLSNSDTTLSQIKLVLTSTNTPGCNNVTDTVKITVNKAPLVKSSLIKPILSCANSSTVFLNGTVSGTLTNTGKWTTSGSGGFYPNNQALVCNYIPSSSDIAAGFVYIKLQSTNNQQCLVVQDSVQIIFGQPATVNLGPGLNSCKNNANTALNAVIGGTVTTTGIWTGGSGAFTPTNTALTPTYIASASDISNGFVILTFSTTNNGVCNTVSGQIRIDFQDKPTANFSVSPVCLNEISNFNNLSINTSGLGGITGSQWAFGDGGILIQSTPPFNTAAHTYTTPGTFPVQLIVKNQYNCYDTINRTALVNVLPVANFSVSRVCSGSAQEIIFTDNSSVSAPSTIPSNGYYWDFGGYGTSHAKDTSIIFPSQGGYNITHSVTSNNGCTSYITKTVNITPPPLAKFIYNVPSFTTIVSNVAFIDSSRSAVSWSWNFGNGQTDIVPNPVTTYSQNGTYTVSLMISDQYGCTSTYTLLLKISNVAGEISKLIPNFITPNNDGKNDFWRLDFINVFYPNANIEIYNRWGDKLYESIGYSNAWDGSYKGAPLPLGVYFYVIKLNDKENTLFKGTITLLK